MSCVIYGLEKIRRNRNEANVSCIRRLCFSKEKMRFMREEVVLYKLKIISKTVNIAVEKKLKGMSEHFWSISRNHSDMRTFMAPPSERDCEVAIGVTIYFI